MFFNRLLARLSKKRDDLLARNARITGQEARRPDAVRRKQAIRDLAKLGLPVEYVNPDAAGDGA
jgi:hypothetical protein